jgi:hypothetical protein
MFRSIREIAEKRVYTLSGNFLVNYRRMVDLTIALVTRKSTYYNGTAKSFHR